eukprot:CCRYP_000265-RA/>CCRYP_000265-RA protein AED:0.41 eAED:0.41 QI:0/-1/0/1/-1/1/1/0/253
MNNLSTDRHVHFASHTQIQHYDLQATTPLITFDSGADSHYLSKTDRLAARLPIPRPSSQQVGIANGSTSMTRYVSRLPFPQLSPNAAFADSFDDFPQSLMSIGKTCDDGTVAIFTQSGVTVHKDTDVLITCQGKPLLIGACNAHGRYHIPLAQHKDDGNRGAHQKKHNTPSAKPTAFTTSHPPNKPQMDARSVWIPLQVRLAQGRPSRKLHWMATAHHPQHPEVLPQNCGNSQRASQPKPKKRQIHQTEAHSP